MSEEYTLMQYENEQLRNDLLYWRRIATESIEKSQVALQLQKEMDVLTQTIVTLRAENEEYHRTNERIWETTKKWVQEDSAIISKQSGQIKFLVEKVKEMQKNESSEQTQDN
jgi:uncharacterized coiled-coil protein SlyX